MKQTIFAFHFIFRIEIRKAQQWTKAPLKHFNVIPRSVLMTLKEKGRKYYGKNSCSYSIYFSLSK